jgi:hypothetical protein
MDITPEVLEELKEQLSSEREKKLDGLGKVIAKIRDEAVTARRESGFERQWKEDEEYYEGIDDLNRNVAQYIKPRSDTGGLIQNKINPSDSQCIEFLNVTRPFVDAASARMGDILLPANDWNFSIKATPVPEFNENEDSDKQILDPKTGQPFVLGDVIKDRNKRVGATVAKAERRMKDWLVQCSYKKECRKVIDGSAMVGTAILYGPYPDKQVTKVFKDGKLVVDESIVPKSMHISHWDFYPDMNCGEDIQNGDYVFRKAHLTARQLTGLIDVPGYESSAIEKVLEEGPGMSNEPGKSTEGDERFEVWYYYGTIKSHELKELDAAYAEKCEDEEDHSYVNAIVVLVNNTVIKGVKNPLDHYGYPFDVMIWKRVPGKPFGIGVAREGRVAQKTILAAFRTMMENMGLASIPMIALLRGAIDPADGDWTLRKGKVWDIKEDSGITNINQAIQTIVIPAMQKELQALLEMAMKMMEDSTGITFLMQGQQGSAPDTVGGMQMMLRSSSTVLRREARIYDENVTEPHINRYYGWLLMHGEDDEKSDLMIEASGSSQLAELEMQAMQLPSLIQMAMNPVFEMSPRKAAQELLRALHFDPNKFDLDEEEKQKMQEIQPPPDPRIQVAQIKAQTDEKIAAQDAQVKQMGIQKEADRDAIFEQGVAARTQATVDAKNKELQFKYELAILEYSNQQKLSLDDAKVQLARDAMKINSTKELVQLKAPADLLPKPPVEPPGLAKAGESFTQ